MPIRKRAGESNKPHDVKRPKVKKGVYAPSKIDSSRLKKGRQPRKR